MLNTKNIIIISILVGVLVNTICFGLTIDSHWIDVKTGSDDPAVLEASQHLIIVKYDYGFPLGFLDAERITVDRLKIHWIHFVLNTIFWSGLVFISLKLINHLKRNALK